MGLALVESSHQSLQLLSELGSHTVQLVCAAPTLLGCGRCFGSWIHFSSLEQYSGWIYITQYSLSPSNILDRWEL